MELDARTCYRALRSRDPRFDGRFFTGVTSTGVFCRPVCPARTPGLARCRFFACAAAAQEAGFRPCLRCRPEAAPGTPPWMGTSTTVARALRLISEDGLAESNIPDLAARLGVGERHLRRLFLQHIGATPIAVVQTQRVLFAKKLLDETSLPLSTVASAAGFASVRRFNAAMLSTYGRPPRALRRSRGAARDAADVTLELAYRPPFDWDALLSYLAARAIPGVESVADGAYQRTARLGEATGRIEVRHAKTAHALRVHVHTTRPVALLSVVARIRQQFDLAADPLAILAHFDADERLRPLVRAHPGLRVPGAWDGFELAVRAVLGQQVSVRAATTLAGRLVQLYGDELPVMADGAAGIPTRLFPLPETLAHANLERIGLPRTRARTLAALAAAVAAGDVTLDGGQDPEATRAALRNVPGIGPWTAEYIALRVLREPDAFPVSDLGLRRAFSALATHSMRSRNGNGRRPAPRPSTDAALARAAEAWRPWRAYAAVHLWTWEGQRASVDG